MPAPAPTTPTAKPSQRIHCCENSNRVPQGRLIFLEADRALPEKIGECSTASALRVSLSVPRGVLLHEGLGGGHELVVEARAAVARAHASAEIHG